MDDTAGIRAAKVRCLECGAEPAGAGRFCRRCGAPMPAADPVLPEDNRPATMTDDWRVCIAFGGGSADSISQSLITALGSRLGDQVTVSSNATRTQIFLYAPSIGLADEAGQVAREVLAQRNISVSTVRTEGWNWRKQEWRDADEMPNESAAEQERARPAYRQEHGGRPRRQVEPEVEANGLPVPRPDLAASTDYRVALASLVCGIVPLGLALIPIVSHKHSGFLAFGWIPALVAIGLGLSLSEDPDKRISSIGRIAVALGALGAVAVGWATGVHGTGG